MFIELTRKPYDFDLKRNPLIINILFKCLGSKIFHSWAQSSLVNSVSGKYEILIINPFNANDVFHQEWINLFRYLEVTTSWADLKVFTDEQPLRIKNTIWKWNISYLSNTQYKQRERAPCLNKYNIIFKIIKLMVTSS